MTDVNNNPAIDPTGHFLLEMPLSKADHVAALLAGAGVTFEPSKAIMGYTDKVGLCLNQTGLNISTVVDAINHYLRDYKYDVAIFERFGELTLADRHAILTLAVQGCDWTEDAPAYVHYIDPEHWGRFRREHPDLIRERETHS